MTNLANQVTRSDKLSKKEFVDLALERLKPELLAKRTTTYTVDQSALSKVLNWEQRYICTPNATLCRRLRLGKGWSIKRIWNHGNLHYNHEPVDLAKTLLGMIYFVECENESLGLKSTVKAPLPLLINSTLLKKYESLLLERLKLYREHVEAHNNVAELDRNNGTAARAELLRNLLRQSKDGIAVDDAISNLVKQLV